MAAGKSSKSTSLPKPPKAYQDFIRAYPKLGEAWELMAEAGRIGPLDEKTIRLVKLAIAIGTRQEGAVHAGVRKAKAVGIPEQAILQVIALASSNIGMPATVATYSWIKEMR